MRAPFGESPTETGNIDHNFTGQNQDLTSVLYDFPAREYHPGEGRWISPDPAGVAAVDPTLPQSWNRYAYVLNDPMSMYDPSGLAFCSYDDGSEPWFSGDDGATASACYGEGGTWVPDQTVQNASGDTAVVETPYIQVTVNGDTDEISVVYWYVPDITAPIDTYQRRAYALVNSPAIRALPVDCSVGAFGYGGAVDKLLGAKRFRGGIVEFDSQDGLSGGVLAEAGGDNAIVHGGAGLITTVNLATGKVHGESLVFGGVGPDAGVVGASAGVVAFGNPLSGTLTGFGYAAQDFSTSESLRKKRWPYVRHIIGNWYRFADQGAF